MKEMLFPPVFTEEDFEKMKKAWSFFTAFGIAVSAILIFFGIFGIIFYLGKEKQIDAKLMKMM